MKTRKILLTAAFKKNVFFAGISGLFLIFTLIPCGCGNLFGETPEEPEDEVTFTVAFDGNGGTWERDGDPVTRLEVTVKKGSVVPLPDNPSKNIVGTFCVGWNTVAGDSGGKEVSGSTVVNSDMVVYARWGSLGEGWNDENGVVFKDFAYLGSAQTFEVSFAGRYKFELWGANGNGNAKGGYSSGSLELAEGSMLSLYVGGKGGASGATTAGAGGWNGGGAGGKAYQGDPGAGGGGGGATDVRLGSVLNTRIIVAGGAGGSAGGNGSGTGTGGTGGGQAGGAGGRRYSQSNATIVTGAAGGTQTGGSSFGNGGTPPDSDQFNYCEEGRGGGGGGYWGGYAMTTTPGEGTFWAGGGGGSGFVYGYTPGVASGSNWIPEGYQSYIFTGDFACVAGAAGYSNPVTTGHGYIRVTYMP